MPDKPKLENFQNYGLPIEEQIFRKIELPEDFHLYADHQQEHYVNYMWHLRFNGEWWLIGGKEVFINGYFWFFLNWWLLEVGTYAEYREEALEFFELWRLALNNPDVYGLLITKGRRIGDTEKSIAIPYDFVTRHRNMWAGMQNLNELDAQDDFSRIVEAHKAMPPFFKPQHLGHDTPKKVLDFRYNTSDEINGRVVDSKQLRSRVDYRPSTIKQYDGKRLGFYRMGEWGKVTTFDILKQWEIVKRCLSFNSGETIVGKSINESTVEEISAANLESAQQFWEDSDPNIRLSNNQTVSGLIRHFRSAELTAPVDKFGRHDREGMRNSILEKRDVLIKKKRYKTASDFMRKNPLSVSDVFTASMDDCDLLPELLDVRKLDLERGYDEFGNDLSTKKGQRFNLYWTNGVGSAVRAIPNVAGDFVISQQPQHPNKWKIDRGIKIPFDAMNYTLGVDSADHKKTGTNHKKKTSDIAGSVFRHKDYNFEDLSYWDEKAFDFKEEYKHNMETDQFVALYVGRHSEPSKDYDNLAKLAVYFGALINCERNKPAFIRWCEDKGLVGYLYVDPDQPSTNKTLVYGQNATTPNIQRGVEFLLMWIEFRWRSMWILEQLLDMRSFTIDTRGKRDITVSMYFALLRAYRKDVELMANRQKAEEEFALPLRVYYNQ